MDDAKPSKSEAKRADLALKALARDLVSLSPAVRNKLPLDDGLRDAVATAAELKAHGALRRQRQLIAKLLRQSDADSIRDSLATLCEDSVAEKRRFRAAEAWRDRLLDEGFGAFDACVDATGADPERLRDAMKRWEHARTEKAVKTARRELFRIVRAALDT